MSRGDRLVADLGLTSERWQVLGGIMGHLPVAWRAGDMGVHGPNICVL
ncbi:MAG TPA: hypothetical protein VGC39_11550 [Candidatus Methylacidiphilales bacterium]